CIDDLHTLDAEEEARLWGLVGLLRSARVLAMSRRKLDPGDVAASSTVVELAPLELDEAALLVRELLDRLGRDGDAAALARASAGSPLWCRLLAGGAVRVEDRVSMLLKGVTPEATALLEQLCVFREPVPMSWLREDPAVVTDLEARMLVERRP